MEYLLTKMNEHFRYFSSLHHSPVTRKRSTIFPFFLLFNMYPCQQSQAIWSLMSLTSIPSFLYTTSLLSPLWWLILRVTLIGHGKPRLTTVSGCVCESVSGWVSIWISEVSKIDCPPQCGPASSNPWRGWRNLSSFACLSVWAGTPHLIFSHPWTRIYIMSSPGSQVLELRLNYTTGFPGFKAAESRHIYIIYPLLVVLLWRTPIPPPSCLVWWIASHLVSCFLPLPILIHSVLDCQINLIKTLFLLISSSLSSSSSFFSKTWISKLPTRL